MRAAKGNPDSTLRGDVSTEVAVIGGGVIGCSIAYHLCRAGLTDVLVLERDELCASATSRAAGLVSHARSTDEVVAMICRTRQAIHELEELLGESIDFRQVGSIRAAYSQERATEMITMEACLARQGLATKSVTAAEARELCSWLELSEAHRITYLPADGYLDGARLGMAYARAARSLGARVERGITVSDVIVHDGAVAGVQTDAGTVHARYVVDAAGAWAAQAAAWLGWNFPAAATRSHYWITAPDGKGSTGQPNVQLPDFRTYIRSEVGGLLVGVQEPQSKIYPSLELARHLDAVPLYDEEIDLDLLIEHTSILSAVVPEISSWRFAHHIAGLSMYTPDGRFVLGRIGAVEGFFVAGGCCGSGVAASAGIGEYIADLIVHGREDMPIFCPDRFGDVDPHTEQFWKLCRAARAGKSRGRPDLIVAER